MWFISSVLLGLAIKGNKSLSDLNLTKCCLDDSSIVRLCQSIMECHLKVLNICSNPFARQGALAVAQLMKTHEYIEQVWAWNADMHHESVCCLLDAMRANQRVKKLLLNSSCRDLIDTTELASLKGRVVFNWTCPIFIQGTQLLHKMAPTWILHGTRSRQRTDSFVGALASFPQSPSNQAAGSKWIQALLPYRVS